jgi:hypothetical protein
MIPLEWTGGSFSVGGCSEDGSDRKVVLDQQIFLRFRDLQIGQESEVETIDCADGGRIVIRVVATDVSDGPRAEHLRVFAKGGDQSLDFGLPLAVASSLSRWFSGSGFPFLVWKPWGDSEDGLDGGPDRNVQLLKKLPPFELLRARDRGQLFIVKTQ